MTATLNINLDTFTTLNRQIGRNTLARMARYIEPEGHRTRIEPLNNGAIYHNLYARHFAFAGAQMTITVTLTPADLYHVNVTTNTTGQTVQVFDQSDMHVEDMVLFMRSMAGLGDHSAATEVFLTEGI